MAMLLPMLLPIGLPVALLILVLFLARAKFAFLAALPLWVFLGIVALLLVVAALIIVIRIRKQKADAAALEAGILDAKGGEGVSQADLDQMQEKLRDAVARLKAGPEGAKALYSIPWYLVMGPPAIGKTTLIRNSGLDFPNLTTAEKMRGTGGTRDCDWWFSSDAILLDTAGRYAQSRERTDSEEWNAFLDLLKKHRRQGPINGLILGYSIETLIDKDDSHLVDSARELRQLLDDVLERLGWTFPTYVLFTKCDLIAGFVEFFSSLSPLERQAAWGFPVEVAEGPEQHAAERFSERFRRLVERTRALRAGRIRPSAGVDDWSRAITFPEAFESLERKLHLFIETLFAPNPYKRDYPLLRGVYFSSGCQDGAPFDLVVKEIERVLGGASHDRGDALVPTEDAYFVQELFSKVLATDRQLVQRTHREGKRRFRMRAILSACMGVVTVLSCLWFATSCTLVKNKIDASQGLEEKLQRDDGSNMVYTLNLLDQLYGEVSGSFRVLPFVVARAPREDLREAYRRASREKVLGPLEKELLEKGRDASLPAFEVRDLLTTEVLLLSPENQSAVPDTARFQRTLRELARFDGDTPVRTVDQLREVGRRFLESGEPLRPTTEDDRQQMRRWARRLNASHHPEAIVAAIVAEAADALDDLELSDLLGSTDDDLLRGSREIPAAYARDGWERVVYPRLSSLDDWIEGDRTLIRLVGETPRDDPTLREDVVTYYAEELADAWSDFLRSVSLRTGSSCDEASSAYRTLKSGTRSPLLALLKNAAAQVSFEGGPADAIGVGSGLLVPIRRQTAPLTDMVAEPEDGAAPIEMYEEILGDLYHEVGECADEPGRDPEGLEDIEDFASDYRDDHAGSDISRSLELLLQAPGEDVKTLHASAKIGETIGRWQRGVVDEWRTVASSYPFDGRSSSGADVKAVCDVLRRDGAIDAFVETLGERGRQPGAALERARTRLTQVRRGIEIGDGTLETSFRITFRSSSDWISASTPEGEENRRRIDTVRFFVNGDEKVVRGNTDEHVFTWSSGDDDLTCGIELVYGGRTIGELRRSGPWGAFQLFDAARMTPTGASGTYRVTWSFPDAGVTLEVLLRTESGEPSPFARDSAFRGFALPDSPIE